MVTGIVILVIIVLVVIGWIVSIYNRLVRLKNQVQNSWAQIDVQLKRRHDLIPNLVECVKEYMQYEKGTLQAVIDARSRASGAREQVAQDGGPTGKGGLKELIGAETALSGALGNIFALAENYPKLRATENMQNLQEELTSTENKVAFSRQAYNDTAMSYNIAQSTIPNSFFAKSFGHHQVDLFEVEEAAREPVKVSFK